MKKPLTVRRHLGSCHCYSYHRTRLTYYDLKITFSKKIRPHREGYGNFFMENYIHNKNQLGQMKAKLLYFVVHNIICSRKSFYASSKLLYIEIFFMFLYYIHLFVFILSSFIIRIYFLENFHIEIYAVRFNISV